MARLPRTQEQQDENQEIEVTTPTNSDNVQVEIFPVVEMDLGSEPAENETTGDEFDENGEPIAPVYLEGRMLIKDGDDGRRRVVIMVKGKVLNDFFAEETKEGIEISYPSAMFTYRGERITEQNLKKAGFSKTVKQVWYNAETEDVRSR